MFLDFIFSILYWLLAEDSPRIPSWLVRRMILNNCISALVSLIPVAGDFILAIYKANSRNAALLEEFLRIRGEEFMRLENEKKTEGKPGTNWIESNDLSFLLDLTDGFVVVKIQNMTNESN